MLRPRELVWPEEGWEIQAKRREAEFRTRWTQHEALTEALARSLQEEPQDRAGWEDYFSGHHRTRYDLETRAVLDAFKIWCEEGSGFEKIRQERYPTQAQAPYWRAEDKKPLTFE